MIPVKQVLDGISDFAVMDVIPTMPNGINKFLAYGAVGAMRTNNAQVLKPYEGMLKQFGLMNEDATLVDETAMKAALEEAFNNVPRVSLFGFTFDSNDLEKLYRRLGV